MEFCRNLRKRKIFLMMAFVGFLLNFLHRSLVQQSVHIFTLEDENAHNILKGRSWWLFFSGYIVMPIPAGRLSEIFGGKTISGLGMLAASILTFAIPLAFRIQSYGILIVINGLLGVCLAPFIPAFFNMASKWIPVEERGQLISTIASTQLGRFLLVMAFHVTDMSAEFLFYVPGLLGIIWSLCWYFLVYDSPLSHPSITREERNYIVLKKESQGTIYEVIDCPWAEIFFEPQVWVIFSTHACWWTSAVFLTMRSHYYMGEMFKLNFLDNPFAMMTPYVLSFVSIFLSGFLYDFLCSIKVPVTFLQKSCTLMSTIIPAIAFVGFLSFQDSMHWTLFFYIFGITFSFWVIAGYYTTFLDIAPNFAGTLQGITSTIGYIGMASIFELLGKMDPRLDRQQQWENKHCLISSLLFTSGILYSLFGSSNLADWNTPYQYEAV